MSVGILIPNRFELLIESPRVKATPTLLAVESDLRAIDFLVNKTKIQGGGALAFLLGATGVGKSTAAYSATVFLSDKIASLVRVPIGVKLRDTVGWLASNLPPSNGKAHLVLYDGREVTDDQVGLRQFMAGLNQLLRLRGDIVFLWPTTDLNWHGEIKNMAATIGGTNFVPSDSDIVISGPPKAEWGKVLERILIQLDTTMADVALDAELVTAAINKNSYCSPSERPLDPQFVVKVARELLKKARGL